MVRLTVHRSLEAPAVAVYLLVIALSSTSGVHAAQQENMPVEEVDRGAREGAAEDDDLLEPSNTGYVDSAIIATRVRVRFDAAVDADAPDRAEFFYGKCECLTRQSGQSGAGSPGPVGGGQPGGDLDYQEFRLYLEYALRDRFSIFVEAPHRRIEGFAFKPFATDPMHPNFDPRAIPGSPSVDDLVPFSGSGLGDVNLGFKYGLLARPERAVTLQLRVYLPTGEAREGVGTDHGSVEPAVLWFEELKNRWNLESEVALWLPTDGSSDPVTPGAFADGTSTVINPATGRQVPAGRDDPVDNGNFAGEVLRVGVGLSRRARSGARVGVSPVAELVGWYVLDGFKSVHFDRTPAQPGRGHFQDANGDLIVNLKLGARIRAGNRSSVYAGYGFALTDQIWYDGIFRVEVRKSFGG